MRRRFQFQISERRLLLMLGDALFNLVAVLLALRLWAWVGKIEYNATFVIGNLWWFLLLGAIWYLLANASDFYTLRTASQPVLTLALLLQITLQMTIIYLIIFFLSPRDALPRLFIIYYAIFSFLLMGFWRLWRPYLIGWTSEPRRLLVIGGGWAANALLEAINQQAQSDYTVSAVIVDPNRTLEVPDRIPIFTAGESLPLIVRDLDIAEIVLAGSGPLPAGVFQGLMDAYEQGITIIHMPLLYEQITGRVPVEHVGEENWDIILPVTSHAFFNPYPLLKRVMDVGLSLVGSLVFLVMMPFLIALIYLDSPGPIFYRQERVGQGGRPFKILKLRTMIPDAEKHSGPKWADQHDPRVTRIGRILRKSRMDEIPQLINVLRGEMSLVGPRPERAFFVDQLSHSIPFYRTRNVIKPGVTGWAQVKHGYGNTTDDALIKLQYDLYYIRHQSLLLDILILLRTARKMLSFGGQ